MEVGIPHTSRMNPGLKSPGKSLKRWYSDFRRGSIKLAKKGYKVKIFISTRSRMSWKLSCPVLN
jgi:hypothetical protein